MSPTHGTSNINGDKRGKFLDSFEGFIGDDLKSSVHTPKNVGFQVCTLLFSQAWRSLYGSFL